VFKDRKIDQTAAEIFRKYFNIQPTTPYHRSLRAAITQAITQAINRAKEGNPGYHAKVNVDLNGRTLKCFVREDTKPPGAWTALEGSISLPPSALDPGLRDMSKVILPTSPNDPSINLHGKTRATDTRVSRTLSQVMTPAIWKRRIRRPRLTLPSTARKSFRRTWKR
jgi:hypothetical protein